MDELVKNSGFEKMISNIEVLVNASKSELAISINKVMTVTYWSIGKYIVEFEQDGPKDHLDGCAGAGDFGHA